MEEGKGEREGFGEGGGYRGRDSLIPKLPGHNYRVRRAWDQG